MASTTTGEMFTQEQYDAMSEERRAELGLVKVTRREAEKLAPLNAQDRKRYLEARKNKKRKLANKRERLNRRKGRK